MDQPGREAASLRVVGAGEGDDDLVLRLVELDAEQFGSAESERVEDLSGVVGSAVPLLGEVASIHVEYL